VVQNTSMDFVQLMKFSSSPPLSDQDKFSNHIYTAFTKDYSMYVTILTITTPNPYSLSSGPYFLYPNSTLEFQWTIVPSNVEVAVLKSSIGVDKFLEWKKKPTHSPPSNYIVFHNYANLSYTSFSCAVPEGISHFSLFLNFVSCSHSYILENTYYVLFYNSNSSAVEAMITYTIYSRQLLFPFPYQSAFFN
jgi:hypothetical protein